MPSVNTSKRKWYTLNIFLTTMHMAEMQMNTGTDPRMPTPPSIRIPGALRVYQVLLVLGAVMYVLGGLAAMTENILIGIFLFVWAAAALLVVWGINTRRMWAFYVSVVLLGLGVISSIVPKLSIFTLAIDVVLLVLIVKQRSYFTTGQTS